MSVALHRATAALAVSGAVLKLAACAELNAVSQGEPDLVESVITRGENRFAITLTALNTDGHELARCLGAGYADALRDEEGKRLHDVFRRDGGALTDEFRVVEGVRTQTTTGVQSYVFDPDLRPADHDGRDVMAVDVQLARCDRAGLPTSVE